ncbi:MAG: hypothetical protein PVJ20_00355 [Desulfobacterales bacterium]|jgi:hypothetical protein
MDKTLAKQRLRDQKCPYCGADRKDLAYGNVENHSKDPIVIWRDGKVVKIPADQIEIREDQAEYKSKY